MALPSNPSPISADEYLNSSYRPDLEYVDGVLVERGMPTFAHGVLQLILGAYFRALMNEFRFVPASEVRTRIVERARYRIPDVALWPLPASPEKAMTVPPWVVIEILSPDDEIPVQIERFREFRRIGVLHIVLLDPEQRLAYRFQNDALVETRFRELEVPTGKLPFDTDAIFRELAESLARLGENDPSAQ